MEQAIPDIHVSSVTEQAKREFLRQVREIPEVFVRTDGGNTLPEQAIRVVVPDILGSIADQVSALEVRIRKQYRHARLSLEIEEAEECHDDCASVEASNIE